MAQLENLIRFEKQIIQFISKFKMFHFMCFNIFVHFKLSFNWPWKINTAFFIFIYDTMPAKGGRVSTAQYMGLNDL